MKKEKDGLYSLPGKHMPIYIRPSSNECGLCRKLPPSRWCDHLVSAAMKEGMQINRRKPKKITLTELEKRTNAQKGKSGNKKPRKRDYIDIDEPNVDKADVSMLGKQVLDGKREQEEEPKKTRYCLLFSFSFHLLPFFHLWCFLLFLHSLTNACVQGEKEGGGRDEAGAEQGGGADAAGAEEEVLLRRVLQGAVWRLRTMRAEAPAQEVQGAGMCGH